MRQFKVNRIFALTERTKHHEAGATFAEVGNEVYKYTGPLPQDYRVLKNAWPPSGILFRDHWAFFADRTEDNGAYFAEVLQATPFTVINYA